MVQDFDRPPDGAEELAALLERSGAEFLREGNRFHFSRPAGGGDSPEYPETVCCQAG